MASVAVSLAITVGGMILQQLFAPTQRNEGARLTDINVPQVSPGNPIVRHWGTMKVGGQLVWTSKLIETKNEEKVGGKGGPKAVNVTYTYSVDCAIAICQGPVETVKRIRANQKLIWVNPLFENEQQGAFDAAYTDEGTRLLENGVDAEEAHVGAFFFAFNEYRTDEFTPATIDEAKAYVRANPLPGTTPNYSVVDDLFDRMFDDLDKDAVYEEYKKRFDGVAIYLGSHRQMPDPTIESYKGVGNVPAFRGTCYMVFKNLQLEDFGNTIPQFHVEVVRQEGGVKLQEIIRDVCLESGMLENEFNVTCGMKDVSLHGFAVTDRMSGRDVIQQLQQLFPFDACETAYTLRFAHAERRPQALIRREDFGAHIMGEQPPPSEEVTRTHDYELPRKLSFKYQEPTRNYSLNTAMAQRMVTESNLEEELVMAIALGRPEARTLVEGALARFFYARRTYKVMLPRKYSILEPGDVVLVPDKANPNAFYSLKLLEISHGNNGLCEATFSDYHQPSYIESVTSADIEDEDDIENGPTQGSRTYAYLLDLPLLTDTEEDNVGFYALLSGTRPGWSGGALIVDMASGGVVPVFGASDPVDVSGATWYVVAENDQPVPHGFALSQLGPAVPGVWDFASKVRLKVLDPAQVLFSYSRDDVLSRAINVIVIGDEILQFARATDLGNGIWEIAELLRGQRGTEHAIGSHAPGDRMVMLAASAIERVVHNQQMLNIEARYRSLSINDDPEDVDDLLFTNTGNSLRPYSPYLRSALRTDDGSIEMSWLPRVRQNGGMLNGQETVLDQPFERYEIDVVKAGVVVRTQVIENDREWVYPAATISADTGGAGDNLTIRLYQIGQIVGRGFVKEFVI